MGAAFFGSALIALAEVGGAAGVAARFSLLFEA